MPETHTDTLPSWLAAWEVRKRPMCELLWVGVPLVAQRLSRALASVSLDGSYLAARPAVGAVLPISSILLGFAIAWVGPGGSVLYQQLPVLAAVLLLASLSGFLGLLFACGFALGDLIFGTPLVEGASWTNAPFTVGIPLLIEYLAVGIFASQLPLIGKGLACQVPLPRFLTGNPRFAAMALIEAVATALMTWGWVRALPILLRPQLAWVGLDEPGDALEAVSYKATVLALMVFLVTLMRMGFQHYVAFKQDYRPWLDHLDRLRQSVPAPKQSIVDRVPPFAMLGLQVLLATLLLAGMFESWLDAVVTAVVVGAVQAARKGILPVLGRWPELADRIPAFARVLAGMALMALVSPSLLWFFFGQTGGMRPMLAVTLSSLVIFLLLLPPRPGNAENGDMLETEPAKAVA